MSALCFMLSVAYYAENYASIIDASLFVNAAVLDVLFFTAMLVFG